MIIMNNDKYHTQYDFMRFVYLSYFLPFSRHADPKRCLGGSFAADILLSFNDVI
jgi:hypothetical protein|uniref:Uncharacterized protein n=1 Tax=Escherichia coli TaxID=562 RepID=A0A7G9AA45_ECOLX|nr:hypothetical protein [Escherichia coli]